VAEAVPWGVDACHYRPIDALGSSGPVAHPRVGHGHLDGGVKALPKLVLGLQRVRDATEGRHEVLAPQPAPPTVFLCERCGLCS
jgi:hypothetical protein